MKKFTIFFLLAQLGGTLTETQVSYKDYRIYKVIEDGLDTPPLKVPGNEKEIEVLKEYNEFDNKNNKTVRSYLVPPSEESDFLRVLNAVKADYNLTVSDLDKQIQEEKRSSNFFARRSQSEPNLQLNVFYTYQQMISYLKFVKTIKNPHNNESLALVKRIGKTYEGRDMYIVKISSDHKAKKPIIFLEAGIHAREWSAPAAALYTISQLTEDYENNQDVLTDVDFYIIPVSNPDGYEYSRTKDRMWRKTRSVHGRHYGVDGNRNFDFHWGEKGTSNDPKSNIYKGPYPFSEIETQNIRDMGRKYKDRTNGFVSVHCYGPLIVYPWGYDYILTAPYTSEMYNAAKEAADAIKKYSGTKYQIGSSSFMLYPAAGGSDDYFKGVLGVDLSFTMELSSAGEGSFVLPASKISGVVKEAFEGLKVLARHAAQYKKKTPSDIKN